MEFVLQHKIVAVLCGTFVLGLLFIAYQILYVSLNGTSVPAPSIPRQTTTYGDAENKPLTLVVLGDSTSIGQGARYQNSIAVKSAEYLAQDYYVSLTNYGVSGATTAEVRNNQIAGATTRTADIALIAVGANDVTKFNSYAQVDQHMRVIIHALRRVNPEIKIVLTGSPQVGSVSRYTTTLQAIARHRVGKINQVYDTIAKELHVTRIPLAEKTGDIFLRDKSLFAADNFHPNDKGYAVWQPLINSEL